MSENGGTEPDGGSGRALWESARNLVKASDELDALLEQVVEALEGASLPGVSIESTEWGEADESDWVTPTWAVDLEVRRPNPRGKPTKLGTATLCLRLYDASEDSQGAAAWHHAHVPKLFCAYWPGKGQESFWDADELSLRADGTSDGTTVKGRTWRREVPLKGGEMVEAWFFCLPVTALTEANLRHQVVEPFLALLASQGAQESFPADAVACVPPASTG